MMSLRIVTADHYMSSPKSGLDLTYSQFRGSQVKSVPVVRIFGSSSSGRKTCLHVHGVFPYILVPFSGDDEAGRLMYQLASSLDKAINVSLGTSYSNRQHVFKIVQVSGRPFYGYHNQDHQFFKIFFYNPLIVKRASDLLQNGAICGTKFQIHEGHVPYILQFFIDYNLHGMSIINLKSVIYRKDASPPGVTPGSLIKETTCDLEADAVAVDILNRLTIEGVLAVNPGLAAIWREEKERLGRDTLEVSQRPEPPLAMSEILLRDKLRENLKFQGKCKTPLKENIPYPIETQRISGSEVLDASMLDTHSISSLVLGTATADEETTLVDEDLVLSLTQNSVFSSSLDQSLMMALDNLAAQNEFSGAISQNVEDDSILGSQMISEEDLFDNNMSDGSLEAFDFSLPPDFLSENQYENDNNKEESDENLEEKIPQLDGIGDLGSKKKKSKRRKRRVLVENSATGTDYVSDGEEILLNNMKDNNCWPESGKQEGLEEIFTDDEPYNSPINNFEDNYEILDDEPINLDLICSFDTVLRGDPSFTSRELGSEDVIFQPDSKNDSIWNNMDENLEETSEKKFFSQNQNENFKEIQNDSCFKGGKKASIDSNSNIEVVPPSHNIPEPPSEIDKSLLLASCSEELLNTSQLDEIFNADLNKGLESICEKNTQQEYEEQSYFRSNNERSEDDDQEVMELNQNKAYTSNENMILTEIEEFITETELNNISNSVEIVKLEKSLEENYCCPENFIPVFIKLQKYEPEELNDFEGDVEGVENQANLSPTVQVQPKDSSSKTSPPMSNSPQSESNEMERTSPKKPLLSTQHNKVNYVVKFKFANKKKRSFSRKQNSYNSFEMSKEEIEKYFSQLNIITSYLSNRTILEEESEPLLWSPIRKSSLHESLSKPIIKKLKSECTSVAKIKKESEYPEKEMVKLSSCEVRLCTLTTKEIDLLSKKYKVKINANSLNKNKKKVGTNKIKQNLNSSKHSSDVSQTFSKNPEPLSVVTVSCESTKLHKENANISKEFSKHKKSKIKNAKKHSKSNKKPVTKVSENVPIIELQKPVKKVSDKVPVIEVQKPVTKLSHEVPVIEVQKPLTKVSDEVPIIELQKPVKKVSDKVPVIEVQKPVTKVSHEVPIIELQKPVTKVSDKVPIVELQKPVTKVSDEVPIIELQKPVTKVSDKVPIVELQKPVTKVSDEVPIIELQKPVKKVSDKVPVIEVQKPVTKVSHEVPIVELQKPVTKVSDKVPIVELKKPVTKVSHEVPIIELQKPVTKVSDKVPIIELQKPVKKMSDKVPVIEVQKPVKKVSDKVLIIELQKPVTKVSDKVPIIELQKPVTKVSDKVPVIEVQKPVTKVSDEVPIIELQRPVTKVSDKVPIIELQKPVTNVSDKVPIIELQKPVTKVSDKVPIIEVQKPVTKVSDEVPIIELQRPVTKVSDKVPIIELQNPVKKVSDEVPIIELQKPAKKMSDKVPVIEVQKPVTKVSDKVPIIELQKPVTKVLDKVPVIEVQKPVTKMSDKVPVIEVQKPVTKVSDKVPIIELQKPVTKVLDKVPVIEVQKPVTKVSDEVPIIELQRPVTKVSDKVPTIKLQRPVTKVSDKVPTIKLQRPVTKVSDKVPIIELQKVGSNSVPGMFSEAPVVPQNVQKIRKKQLLKRKSVKRCDSQSAVVCENQSTRQKLDRKCVLKVLAHSMNKGSTDNSSNIKDESVLMVSETKVKVSETLNKNISFQDISLGKVSVAEKLNNENNNINPAVSTEKAAAFYDSGKSTDKAVCEKEIKGKPGVMGFSKSDEKNTKKRPRKCLLDGAVDNSSSNENLNYKTCTVTNLESNEHPSTSVTYQKSSLGKMSMTDQQNQENNINPVVSVGKNTGFYTSGKSTSKACAKKEIENDFKSGTKNRSNLDNVIPLNKKSDEKVTKKRRPLRTCSLDETVDNSSSDDNFNYKTCAIKNLESKDHPSLPVMYQKSNLGEASLSEKLNQENRDVNPIVSVKNIIGFSISGVKMDKTVAEKKVQSDTKSGIKRCSSLDKVTKLKYASCGKNTKRRKPLRLCSLDGTVDNSSSDENLDDKTCTVKRVEATDHTSTPNKRRKSKTCRSPRNYVPLNIEIKRSPKVKTVNDNEWVKLTTKHTLSSEPGNEAEAKNIVQVLSTTEKLETPKVSEKRKWEPLVSLQRLGAETALPFSSSNLAATSQPSTSTSTATSQPSTSTSAATSQPSTSTSAAIHPVVKRLKVSVRRLSWDNSTQEDGVKHERVSKLTSRRSHRSSSLPLAAQEEEMSTEKVQNKPEKGGFEEEEFEVTNDDGAIGITKGQRVRKALVFPDQSDVLRLPESDLPESSAVLTQTRRFSTDIFDANSTPDSISKISNSGDNLSPNTFKLSGISETKFSDFHDETLISELSVDNSSSPLSLPEFGLKISSLLKVDTNPKKLKNPFLFTPALDPPSRSEVLAKLGEYGLPQVVNEEPFYSELADVSKACEVGSTMLKLKSKSVYHLEEFESPFSCLSKLRKERLRNSGFSLYAKSFSSKKSVFLTPLKAPPTQLEAKEWLKSKLARRDKEITDVKKVTKIMLPSSPGNLAGDESTNDSMTISQCTPLSQRSVHTDTDRPTQQSSPEVAGSRSASISPLMASTPVSDQLAITSSKNRFARPSSAFRQALPLIKEECQDHHQEDTNRHRDETNLQSASATQSSKQLSDSGIRKLLSESKSPASMSCQIDTVTPNNSGNYRMELENLQDVKLVQEVSKNIVHTIQNNSESKSPASMSCQIDTVTPNNSGNYRMELENLQDVKLVQEHQFLTILSMELHVHTRGDLRPNPDHDAICCIFYNITNDYPDPSIANITGAIYVSDDGKEERMPQFRCEFQAVPDEQSLVAAFLALVRKWDPDIFVGYEIELLSWGYLLQRAFVLGINLVAELSRVRLEGRVEDEPKEVGEDDSEIRLAGRIVINLWRFLRHEVALQSYAFENIMYHVLHQRIPLFSFLTLTSWWAHRTKLYRWLVFKHYFTRVEGIARLMQQLDLVGRTSEFARLFGIQFYEVLSRGSQFRVESMMLRLVKPLNYVAVSPSIQQRAKMRAPESLPLIMEPQSRFYSDPVIVLDFQSLYPSIIIAYNYCYSTCLGRVEHLGRSELFEFGCTQLRVPVKELLKLKNSLNFSPCGVAYVNQSIVRGVLPRMLEEILNTRLMVKQSMKENKDNKTLQRVLHNRQLGLKLIANVTYGYTAANFSGRMPCIEVGDSVVSKARETLERAISLVGKNPQWGARVIYGDTDSMFVLVPGKSREEAFRIGAEIAEAVTNDNPQPVKLKLEKVYQPCLLQTKKRYVGYMYESANQEVPVYDAKGIETVRRDGCPAVAKVLEKSLRLLFETKDMSLVKRYVCRQFSKVLSGRISVQDLTFAREYRGASGYRPTACVPALELARQGRAVDPRSEPRVGERVPYVVVAGAPGLPLIRLVRPPATLLHDHSLKINAEYYISRVLVPPLDRCLSLLGAQVASWYSELPRKQHLYLPNMEESGPSRMGTRKATISQYFATCGCAACGRLATQGVCPECQLRPQQLAITLASRVLAWERRLALVNKICQSCCGRASETDCSSLDCPVLYRLYQSRKDLKQADYVRILQQEYLNF